MTKLEAIEQQIAELDPESQAKLLAWLSEHRAVVDGGGVADRLRLLRELKGAGAPRAAADIDGLIRQIRGDD
jgi:hypothetical protein